MPSVLDAPGPARRLRRPAATSPAGPRPATGRSPRESKDVPALFRRSCAGCHGADGKLGPAPPLNDRLFLAQIPDAELRRVIAEGRPGTLMPAFATANGGELDGRAGGRPGRGHQDALGTGRARPERAPPYLLPRPGPTEATAGNDERGPRGLHAWPAPPATATMAGAASRPARGDQRSDFLALISDQALRRIVITGRPDLGMPDYADRKGRPEGFQPLTSEDVANLVALLADWRRQGGSVPRKGD